MRTINPNIRAKPNLYLHRITGHNVPTRYSMMSHMSRILKGAVPPRFCFACGSRFLASAIETSFHCSRLIENVFFCRVTKVTLHEAVPPEGPPEYKPRRKQPVGGVIDWS